MDAKTEKASPPEDGDRQEEDLMSADSGGNGEDGKNYESDRSEPSADGRIMLGSDVEIFPTKERPDLSFGLVRAFEAKDRRAIGEQVAYISDRGSIPRITAISSYRHLKSPNILRLCEAGVVNWEPEGRQLFAMVFDRPPGRKFLSSPDGKPYKLSEDRLIANLIQPILNVLVELRNVDLVHSAINVHNIFFTGSEGAETAFLGECISCAAGLRQHALFEPVERAMAQPTGRGKGTYKDDIYAFGVCVAMAARGENLLAGKTEEEVLHGKLESGSYGYLIGRERMPSGIAEFLRGVLNDDEETRWDVDEALRWLEGRRHSPKQPRSNWLAARPFVFKDKKYRSLRALAHAFSQNIADAAAVAETDQFDLWIKRNFEDKELFKHLEDVWDKEKGGARERIIAQVCMVLDMYAPVRYKGLSIRPRSLGIALADAIVRGDDVQPYGEMVSQQIFNAWINLRFTEIPDAAGLVSVFEKCRNYLHQKIKCYGLERVLYTLSRDSVCMSPLFKDYFVISPGGVLMALEKMTRQGIRPDTVFDRHMIAFISVRESKMIDPFLGYITSRDRGHQMIGVIRALATIQMKFNIQSVPSVTAWMVDLIDPVIERFYDRELRKEIRKHLVTVKEGGNLRALLDLVDDNRIVQEDLRRFTLARKEYAMLLQEKAKIENYIKRRKFFGYATGRQVAMLISSLLSSLCILGYLAFYFTRSIN